MATKNVTPGAATPTTHDTTRDKLCLLSGRTRQLHALLMMTYGEAADSFGSLNAEDRENYLWACADMANDCTRMADEAEACALAEGRA